VQVDKASAFDEHSVAGGPEQRQRLRLDVPSVCPQPCQPSSKPNRDSSGIAARLTPLAAGVLLLFAPALGVTVTYAHTLLGIWGAKVGLNGWRCLTALVRIHCVLWPRWEAAPDTSDAYFTACDAGSISGGRGTSSTLNAERRTSNDSLAAYAEVD